MNNKDFQNGFALGRASGGVVEVEDTTKLDALETLIDESGVLEDKEGSVTEKVEQLIYRAELITKTKTINFKNDTSIEAIGVYLDSPFAFLTESFYGTTNLKYMKGVNTSGTTNVSNMFRYSGIETIEKPLDFSSVANATNQNQVFTDCNNLVDVRFKSGSINYTIRFSSELLSNESVESIIDGLAVVSTTQSLILQNAVIDKLTDEQKNTITNVKNWSLVGR